MSKFPTDDGPLSLAFHADRYVDQLRRRLFSAWTIYARRRHLARFIAFCQRRAVVRPAELDRDLITAYQCDLCDHRTKLGLPLKAGTMQHHLVGLNAFLGWLVQEQFITHNPCSGMTLPRKDQRLPRAVLNRADIDAILALPDTHSPVGLRDRTILEVLYSTGLRRMEICRLDLAHVDQAEGLVRVEQGKGRKDRLVPIGPRAVEWLRRYLTESRLTFEPQPGESAVFLNYFGRRISGQVLGRAVRQLVRRANLGKPGSCHLFRHAFATELLRNGCDLRHIQAMLGHASLETTQLYTHLDTRQLQAAHYRFHPGHAIVAAAAPATGRARLLAEVQTMDEGDLDRALDYLGLLKLARLHRPAPRVATAAPA